MTDKSSPRPGSQKFITGQEIIRLWLLRPPEQRTEHDVLAFHQWLARHEPGLTVPHNSGYLELFTILRRHIERPGRPAEPPSK